MTLSYCSLASGSSGNCHFIKTNKHNILLDVGMSARYIDNSLKAIGEALANIDMIFITHEHIDHVKGLPVIMRKIKPKVYMNKETFEAAKKHLDNVELDLITLIDLEPLSFEDLTIFPFEVSHDSVRAFGYKFECSGKVLAVTTDIGEIGEDTAELLSDVNFLVLEANHDERLVAIGPYPYMLKRRVLGEKGHLSNENAGILASEIYKKSGSLKTILLAHLSKENNYRELAFMTVKDVLEKSGIIVDRDVTLDVTHRDKISNYYKIV